MLESLQLDNLGAWAVTPWIYVIVAASVLLDVFLPVLPSGVLVIAAATAAAAGTRSAADAVGDAVGSAGAATAATAAGAAQGDVPDILVLVLCAATASCLGDLVAYRLAWRGGHRLDRAIARSRRLTRAQARLGSALTRGGGALVLVARFAPAGRSVVSLGAGAMHRRAAEFVPWSALAGLAWAGYSVSLGYFGGQLLGATWLGTAVSVAALFAAGVVAGAALRRPHRGEQPT
ncbi:VTT domain-containing protein [Streptomyces pathocidini]|uniref:DedA family protein n=1 Tax=Streptomyces pathocidini TaxID=1650571 RepID=A0ABW7UU74_9ACTN|nr:VTT domain-containing protein [Streptomyces pathocidini]